MHPLARLTLVLLFLAGCTTGVRRSRQVGPWDLHRLEQTPAAQWGIQKGLVQEVFYEGEPFRGKPTRVFGYLGRPSSGKGPFPAIVLVHGGGGTAFPEWAEHWAKRGYLALAMDTVGGGPKGHRDDGGPPEGDDSKFREFTDDEVRDCWTYHAVAAVIRGHSLLRSLPDVDPNRIGITGISWGGYLTCIVAGLDHRLKVAVPVYGCGFLGDNSYWTSNAIAKLTVASRERWLRNFDPSQYLSDVDCPILFLNGSNDFAYPLDSYQKSYRLVRAVRRSVSVVLNLPHGHIWTFPEVDAFVDRTLNGGPAFPRISPMQLEAGRVRASYHSDSEIRTAGLNYTLDAGPWQKRIWKSQPATISKGTLEATLPKERPLVFFLSATNANGLRVSAEHQTLVDGR